MAIKTFTTGEVLTAADTNTYLNNGGLVYITKKSFTNTTTWDCTGVFSSTYDNYLLTYECTSAPVGGAIVAAQMLSGSTPITTTTYAYYETGNQWGGTVDTTAGGTVATSWFAIRSASFFFGTINIFNPNLATYTTFVSRGIDLTQSWQSGGVHQVNASYDGIRFSQAGNMTGSVTFYGYRKA